MFRVLPTVQRAARLLIARQSILAAIAAKEKGQHIDFANTNRRNSIRQPQNAQTCQVI